ncbi:MAG: PaaI family thioesterase [Syntrophomonadaceae bacterium]
MPTNSGLDDQLFTKLLESISHTPFYQLLGMKVKELGPGYAEFTVMPEEKHTNPLGIIHGGLLMTIADAAMGNAIRSLGIRAVTVDCSTGLVSSATLGTEIIARGRVLKAGRNMIFTEAFVYAGDKLITTAKGTFFRTGDIT